MFNDIIIISNSTAESNQIKNSIEKYISVSVKTSFNNSIVHSNSLFIFNKVSVDNLELGNNIYIIIAKDGSEFLKLRKRFNNTGAIILDSDVGNKEILGCLMATNFLSEKIHSVVEENNRLKERLEQIKLINQAKCILIEHKNMSEQSAHKFIEQQAMNNRITKFEIAKNILKTLK